MRLKLGSSPRKSQVARPSSRVISMGPGRLPWDASAYYPFSVVASVRMLANARGGDSVACAALRGIVGDWFRRSNKEVSKAVLDIIERSGKRYLAILGHSRLPMENWPLKRRP